MVRKKTSKWLNYLFLDTTPEAAAGSETWARVGKSTEWTDTMNAQSETYDYIEDSSPTDVLKNYQPSTSVPFTAYIGDPVYDYVFDLYSKQAVGTAAVTKSMRVFENKDTTGKNKAQMTDCTVTVDNYNFATGIITFTVKQSGTPTLGTATVVENTDAEGNKIWTPTFTAATPTPAG